MSRANIQSLLQMQPIEPLQAQRTPVEFKESSFSGGQFRPGEMSALPAKSSEVYMYEALAEIASGTQQSLNIFADIGQRIENETIQNSEIEWERIDALEIDPREKVQMFNKHLENNSTILSGDAWKRKLTNRMAKSWGPDAFEQFVSDEYNSQAKEWDKFDGKMGPVLSDEFLEVFAKNNPSLVGSNFYTSLRNATTAQLVEQEQMLVTNQLLGAKIQEFSLPSDLLSGLADGSLDIEQARKINPKVVTLLEQAYSYTDRTAHADVFKKEFYDATADMVSTFDPDIQYQVRVKLSEILPKIEADFWNASRLLRKNNNDRMKQALAASASLGFLSAPNPQTLKTFGEQSRAALSNMNSIQQEQYLRDAYTQVYNGLATNQYPEFYDAASFTLLPPAQQLEIVDNLFKESFGPGLDGVLKDKTSDFKDLDSTVKYLSSAFKVSKQGQQLWGGLLSSVESSTKQIIDGITLDPNIPLETSLGSFVDDFDAKLGLTRDLVQSGYTPEEARNLIESVFFTEQRDAEGNIIKDANGQPIVTPRTDTIQQMINEGNVDVLVPFTKAGLSYEAIEKLRGYVVNIIEAKARNAPKGGTATTLDKRKYLTTESALGALISEPGLLNAVDTYSANPSRLNELSPEAQQDFNMLIQAKAKIDYEARTVALNVLVSAGKITEQELELYLKPQSAQTLQEQTQRFKTIEKINTEVSKYYGVTLEGMTVLDPTKPISWDSIANQEWTFTGNNGVEYLANTGNWLGLRTAMIARTMHQLPESTSNEFFSQFRRQFAKLGNGSIANVKPHELYPVLFVARGLALTGTNFNFSVDMSNQGNKVFESLVKFIATSDIPTSVSGVDNKASQFLSIVQAASRVMGNPSEKISVIPGAEAKSISETASDVITQIGTGRIHSYYGLNEEDFKKQKVSDKTTQVVAQLFGIAGRTTEESLVNVYNLISPLFASNSSFAQTGNILPPTYNGSMMVQLPNQDPKPFNSLSVDEKLVYYFDALGKTDRREAEGVLMTLLSLQQSVPPDQLPVGTANNAANRIQAMRSLSETTREFNLRNSSLGGVPFYSVQFAPRNWDYYMFPGWSPNIIRQGTTLPSLDTSYDPSASARSPEFVLKQALQATFPEGIPLSFSDMSDIMDKSSDPNARSLFRSDFENTFSDGTTFENRRGVRKGLDPVDLYVASTLSLPASKENLDWLIKTYVSPEGIQLLESKSNEIQAMNNELAKQTVGASDVTVFEMLKRIDPETFKTVTQKLQELKLGLNEANKTARFSTNPTRTQASIYYRDKNGNHQNIPIYTLPSQPTTSTVDAVNHRRLVRWTKTMLELDRLQGPQEPDNKSKTKTTLSDTLGRTKL